MSDFVIALMFGGGVGVFIWSKMAQGSGNAQPTNVFIAAGIVGFLATIFFFTLLKILHIG